MASLDEILAQPIAWTEAATKPDLAAFLDDMQANVLKGHGRKHAAHVFLGFGGMTPEAVAEVLRALANHVTSAHAQLRRNLRYPPHLDAGTLICLFLGAGGYRALGPLAAPPPGAAFAAGMAGRQAVLSDPPRAQWSPVGWRDEPAPDAMVLLADAELPRLNAALGAVIDWLNGTGARILVIERGNQQFLEFAPGRSEGVEHFGYVDGRSQPLFLAEDLAEEKQDVWSARFDPKRFILADPNGRHAHSAGSYFVFRKLEQDVRGFKAAERALADTLFGPATPANQALRERAGAMVVGRFEDGTPIVESADALGAPPPNDFNYDGDVDAARCPFHAHIRKTNPRGDVRRQFGLPNDDGDRNPIMARRGMTYGEDRPLAPDRSEFGEPEGGEPTGDVGLLFMAYMSSLEDQFEFTQQSWANNPGFVRDETGIDPIIGQGAGPAERTHLYLDGHTPGATPKPFAFADFVRMLGGEYFFAPSLSFLRGVGLP